MSSAQTTFNKGSNIDLGTSGLKLRRLDLRGEKLSRRQYQNKLSRAKMDINSALEKIAPILEKVKNGNEADLIALAESYDQVTPPSIKVPKEIIKAAFDNLDPIVKSALEKARAAIIKGHEVQLRKELKVEVIAGGQINHKFLPVERVGLYVPGGRAVYPSSVLMNVIPAQLAHVPSIAIATPPTKENNGWPNQTILATAYLLGVDEVYAIGGAQAIALFAYGMDGICEPVNLVTGPGNIYVAAAKRALRGLIAIDSEAGPTEVMVIADKSAKANEVAADLISQAEHDEIAAAILVTDNEEFANQVEAQVWKKVFETKHSKRISIALQGEQSGIVLVDDMSQAAEVANAYGAEHLEIQVENLDEVANQITNAGAVFLGRFSPVSLGDYLAGSNHVLPTGGCACHTPGLSVQTFLKGVSFIKYDQDAFNQTVSDVITLANSEDLPAHGQAMSARLEK